MHDQAIRTVEAQFSVLLGRADRVERALGELDTHLDREPGLLAEVAERLGPLLGQRSGDLARELFDRLVGWIRAAADPGPVASHLLGARDATLQRRAVLELADLAHAGRLLVDEALIGALPEPSGSMDDEALDAMEALVEAAGRSLVELLRPAVPPHLRLLAAHLLDRDPQPVPLARVRQVLGDEPTRVLARHLSYTRATHRDLVELSPVAPLPLVADLPTAEELLGPTLLGEVIGQLGWERVAWGLDARRWIGLSVDGSLPFVLSPPASTLFEEAGGTRRVWDRFLVTAHGGSARIESAEDDQDGSIQRFRRYNLVHAEALTEILEVAPVTVGRTRRIIDLLDSIVADYAVLFSDHTEEARLVPEVWAELRGRVLDLLDPDEDSILPADDARLVQMFEEPLNLGEVRTVHGLKRYLHQSGLRLAFRLFRSGRTTNRTVDLVLASQERVLHVVQRIQYLDFEPGIGLPLPVELAAEAFRRQLLVGNTTLPSVEILGYGNEVQVYVSFRNHPAFVRLDLSPPLRGGMIDLEYFGVSQYELDQHPDLSLQGIQRLFRRMEFDAEQDALHLHFRYDKERALDLGDLVSRAAALFRMVPYLMDLDWVIGGMSYPESSRQLIAEAWAELMAHWGVLPLDSLLTSDRTGILCDVEHDAAGRREVRWDGRGAYRDRVSGRPGRAFMGRLRTVLEERGLGGVARWEEAGRGTGQLALERSVLRPLDAALERGEAIDEPEGVRPLSAAVFRRDHEGTRLAQLLLERGPALDEAARLGRLAQLIERTARFRTTGTVNGYPVQRALLPLRDRRVVLFVLRDAQGICQLALATSDGVLYRRRVDEDAPWIRASTLSSVELLPLLLRDNYLTEGALDVDPAPLADLFAVPSPVAVPGPAPGERVISGVVAAPGRASGFARTRIRPHDDLSDAVLLAPAIRPEDAPSLRSAAAIVSTGGGVLSHAGLIALELDKPALIVAGRWEGDEVPVLLYRRADFEEEQEEVGPYRVVTRRSHREREEAIRDGDLVVVDANLGTLAVLGQDGLALALSRELGQLEEAADRLAHAEDGPELLDLRGRLLRAAHQLGKVLGRLDRPHLARYAARELLHTDATPSRVRRELMRTLFDNPRSGAMARDEAGRQLEHLTRLHRGQARDTLRDVRSARNPFELTWARLALLRLQHTLGTVTDLLAECGLPCEPPPTVDVDAAAWQRLEVLRHRVEQQPEPHRAQRITRLDELLGRPVSPSPAPPIPPHLAGQRVIRAGEGGLELAPLVGAKAANLGEIASLLGPEHVPDWFAVTDLAFQEALAEEMGGRPVDEAVAAILATDADPARQAAAIRALWLEAPLPADLEAELRAAYRALGDAPQVAIRSSACGEDSEEGSWAGQFDTFLFVRGEQAVLDHIALAWAGLWTERALHHRAGEARSRVGGGVVVQRMVDSRVSGVLHTVSAATRQLREMVINVGLGLGEGVVSGTIEVDHVVVSRDGDLDDLRLRYTVGDKREQLVYDEVSGQGTRRVETRYHQRLRAALEYVEIHELVHAALALERAYGQPLDIEFAYEGPWLRILQARPVRPFHTALHLTLTRYPLTRPGGPRPAEAEEQRP